LRFVRVGLPVNVIISGLADLGLEITNDDGIFVELVAISDTSADTHLTLGYDRNGVVTEIIA